GSQAVLDFGVEVAGLIAFDYETNDTQPLSLAFTESSSFIGNISDDTGGVYTQDWDRALNVTVNDPAGFYTMPSVNFRGGFRFLTLNARANISVSNTTCDIGFAPNMPDLRAYTGHFSTSESYYNQLGRLWAAGAYTVQTNIVPQNTGRWLPQVRPGWAYNASLGVGEGPFLVDGAKRDRAIWPGDLGISGPAAALAFGEAGLLPWRNGLETLIHHQNTSSESYGEFPFAGPDTNSFRNGLQSETYHAWTLISIYDYVMYSGDEVWLDKQWKNAVDASKLKESYNKLLWDTSACLFFDNTTTTLHPQDGNALALSFNLTTNASQATDLSSALTTNWNKIGPVTPELPDTISPFVSGIELLGHFRSGNPDRGLDLLHRLWGYLLKSPLMTGSTFAEGISANGSLWYRSTAGYNHDPKYTSLSHSWSVAPVQALIHEVVGLKILKPGGREWVLEPKLGNLSDARAGFETPLGKFVARVRKEANGTGFVVEVVTPVDTKGTVIFP
ncbi:glycoside hydrolase family 78 protein, partial [Pseudocercospora fijiensis CIRAD86]